MDKEITEHPIFIYNINTISKEGKNINISIITKKK